MGGCAKFWIVGRYLYLATSARFVADGGGGGGGGGEGDDPRGVMTRVGVV